LGVPLLLIAAGLTAVLATAGAVDDGHEVESGATVIAALGVPMLHRLDSAHVFTPRAFRCPACKVVLPMRVEWPFWRCPQCDVRLIPADLFPPTWDTIPDAHTKSTQGRLTPPSEG
jgi:hypothetical protein